jgi:aldehyde dehydrogenase (NAD+)
LSGTFPSRLFIGGEFVDGVDGATIEVLNPHDCSVLTEVAEARADDVDRAVAAAAAAAFWINVDVQLPVWYPR